MGWFSSVMVGLLFGILSALFSALLAGLFVVDWYRISNFEGQAGYFVVFVALLGGLVGTITGTVCARIVAASAEPTFLAGAALAAKSLAVMFAIATLFTWLGAPPPPATQERVAPPTPPAEADPGPDEQAIFEALDPAAPLAVWLPYTRYGSPPLRMERALAVIGARADLLQQLAPLLHAPDSTMQSDALRVLESLPEQAPAFVADVEAVGNELVDAITRFNNTAPADDPRQERAADISIRFSAWMVAVRALRAHGAGDFCAQLRAIAEAARVRADSHVMREDVLRVAEHYLQEWTAADTRVEHDR